jgi:hypothetical protein
MSGLFSWFGQMWQSLQSAADLSADSTATEVSDSSDPCHLFADALDEELRKMDEQNQRISDLMDQFWSCRERQSAVGSVGTEDPLFQRWQIASANKNGAKQLLKTSASRVRQVVAKIDSIGRMEQ